MHQEDGARFLGCEVVRGDLVLGGALLSASDFTALRYVEGDLVIGPSYQLRDISALGGLRRIGGSLRVQNNIGLGGVFLGALTEIGGDVRIEGNSALRTVSLHRLKSIGGALALAETNRALDRVDLSRLGFVGGRELKIDWRKDRPEAVLGPPLY